MACFTCQVKTARKRSLKNYVIPEKAGIHCVPDQQSAPAFAGATVYLVFIPLSGPQAHARSEESADLVQFEVCGFYGSDHGESRRPAQGAGLRYPVLAREACRAFEIRDCGFQTRAGRGLAQTSFSEVCDFAQRNAWGGGRFTLKVRYREPRRHQESDVCASPR